MSCEEDRSIHPLTIIFHLIVFGVVGFFVYEVLDSYRPVLSKVIYRIFVLLLVILVVLMLAAANYFFVMFKLGIEEKSLANQHSLHKLNSLKTTDLLVASTAKSVEEGRVFLDKYKVDELAFSVKALPRPIKQPVVLPERVESDEKEIKNELLRDLSKDLTVLIVCPKQGVGKTSLMSHIAIARMNRGDRVIVLDAHYYKDNWKIWHPNLEIYGKGKNYDEIKIKLEWLRDELDRRYGSPEDFPHITVVMDEMATTCSKVGAEEYFLSLLTEGRKSGIFFIGASHSTTVKSIGISGNGELKKGFSSILFMEDNFIIERVVFSARGNEISSFYNHPGALDFSGGAKQPFAHDKEFLSSINSIMNKPFVMDSNASEKDKVEAAFYELSKTIPKPSLNEISDKVFGYHNGKTTKKVKDVLLILGLKTD